MAIWLSALVGAGLALIVFFGTGGVHLPSNMANMIPYQAFHLIQVRDHQGNILMMPSYLMVMVPAFLVTLVSSAAILTLQE